MDSTHPLCVPAEVDTYLAALDEVLPSSAVAGVYLVGSTALGDYRPGQSDLDILTLTQHPLSDAELDALDRMHQSLEKGKPHLDAEYVPRECVGLLPKEDARGHAHVVDGHFGRGPQGLEFVLWATLDQCGIRLRGPEPRTWNAAPDAAEFRAWNLGNLESYWRPNFGQHVRDSLATREPDSGLSTEVVVWIATGPGRLHRTIATGEIISKTASADYSAELFPAYAPILMRAKASRLGDESVGFVARDGLALADFVDELCNDAARLAARPA